MSTATPAVSGAEFARFAGGIHGTAADANPWLVTVGGKYVGTPTAVDSGDAVAKYLDQRGYDLPALGPILLDSVTTATGSGVGTFTTGVRGFKHALIVLSVSTAGGTTPTLDVYIDSRLDGTNTVNIGRFAAVTGTGTSIVALTKAFGTNQAVVDGSADAGAGTFRAIGWGDDLRIRRNISGTSPSISYTVYVHLVG